MLWAEINLNILRNNLRIIRALAGDGVEIMPVLKENAYGHGALEIARCLEKDNVRFFAVDDIAEGIELRKAGISADILLLNTSFPEEAEKVVEYNLTSTLYNMELAEAFGDLFPNGVPVKVHVRVDINKSGIGVEPCNLCSYISYLKDYSGLQVEGIYTHLLGGYSEDYKLLNSELQKFKELVSVLDIQVPYLHAASSPAIIMNSDSFCNIARSGTALYGLPSFSDKRTPGLEPVMEIKTSVLRVETYQNELNGYQNSSCFEGSKRVAVLPYGYGDLPYYMLVKEGYVLIHGQRCPFLAKSCMCHVLVDVSHLSGVKVGDEVVIMGKQGSEEIRCEELADKAGISVLNCESICFLDRAVLRKYFDDDRKQTG